MCLGHPIKYDGYHKSRMNTKYFIKESGHSGFYTMGHMAPQSHPVLRSDMQSTETREQLATKNNTSLRQIGPSFRTRVEGDLRLQANRILGIGLQITL